MVIGVVNGPKTYRVTDNKWPSVQVVWDGKDDEKIFEKAAVLTRYLGLTAGGFALVDICMMPRPNPGIYTQLSRIKFWGVPIVGGGLAYLSIVHLSSSIRKKSDERNHMYGGWAVGAVVGKCSKCFITGLATALFFGAVGYICKQAAIEGVGPTFAMHENRRVGHVWTQYWDLTYKPDRKGYWVRTPEEIPELMKRGQM